MTHEKLFRHTTAVELSHGDFEDEAHQSSDEELTEGEEFEKRLLGDQEALGLDKPMFASSTTLATYLNYNTVGYSLSIDN